MCSSDLAQKLHVLYTAEQEKTAAARHNGLTAASQRLDEVLAAAGVGAAGEKHAAFREVAAAAAEHPAIANAVLTLQAAAAQSTK